MPSLAVIGVLATAGMLLSQASYRGAGLAAPLATLTVVNPVVAAAVGITMFGETFRYGTTGTALALGCGVVAAGGLILLTTERIGRTHAEPAQPLPQPEPSVAAGALEDVLIPGPLPSPGAGTRHGTGSETVPQRPETVPPALVDTSEAVEPSDTDPASGAPPYLYGPFYGGTFVPLPVLDRHRTRVKS